MGADNAQTGLSPGKWAMSAIDGAAPQAHPTHQKIRPKRIKMFLVIQLCPPPPKKIKNVYRSTKIISNKANLIKSGIRDRKVCKEVEKHSPLEPIRS